jgi:hypothetical protein
MTHMQAGIAVSFPALGIAFMLYINSVLQVEDICLGKITSVSTVHRNSETNMLMSL